MSNKKLAIDIVLELPREIVNLSIKTNKSLIEKFGKKIELGKESSVPHITLAFVCINESDLPLVIEKVESLMGELGEQFCELSGFKGSVDSAAFEVLLDDEMISIRDRLVGFLKTLHIKEVSKDDFVQTGDGIRSEDLDWVKNYLYKPTYWPHISLGKGDVETYVDFPLDFICEKVTIYQLGRHCTCEKKLFEYEF